MPQKHRPTNDRAQAYRWTRRWVYRLVSASIILGGLLPAVQAQLTAGNSLVIDFDAGTGGLGALFRVDPSTGTRVLFSDFGKAAQGLTGFNPTGVAVEAIGTILVIDTGAGTGGLGALFRVASVIGTRTLLSDFGNAVQGPTGVSPIDVAVEATGTILVIDVSAGTSFGGGLFRVDPVSGTRALLSDFGKAAQGPKGVFPVGVAVEAAGTILVSDMDAGTDVRGALFRVNPATGRRTRLSDFGNSVQGPLGVNPGSMAVEAAGTILVSDVDAGTGGLGALFRVDPATGTRALLSDFGNGAQGPTGIQPNGVAVEAAGTILVIDLTAGTDARGALFRVDPATGTRALLSDFGKAAQGPTGRGPFGVAVRPTAAILVDHFLCYKANPTVGTPKFAPRTLTLSDQFETGDFEVTKPLSLCNPADKLGEGMLDPDTHLQGYQLKGPKHVQQTNIQVTTQFGTLTVDTVKANRLLVPSAKSLEGPIAPPDPSSHAVDHYKCYTVKVSTGTPKFQPIRGVAVDDQFIADPGKAFDLTQLTQLCAPVDKNGEGIKHLDRHLLCYQAKPAKGQPKHDKVLGVFVNNQFDPEQAEQLDTVKEEELCVPATKTLPDGQAE